MKNTSNNIIKITSVNAIHAQMGLGSPINPLISIIDHSSTSNKEYSNQETFLMDLYCISIKKSFNGKLKYGKNLYDFDRGTFSFIAPNQIFSVDNDSERNKDGWSLLFHHDLIKKYPLGKTIKKYGFFFYEVNEALHISAEEEKIIETIINNIKTEICSRLDNLSQDLIVSNLELLLNYCNRFYSRQFVTRKMASSDLLVRFENILDNHFLNDTNLTLLTVENIAKVLNISPSYLSDMLKNITGKSTQQHIHDKLIEKAKEVLITTNLTVTEVAFQLGFEYSQSFSKLFKNKTSLTPIEFRRSFSM